MVVDVLLPRRDEQGALIRLTRRPLRRNQFALSGLGSTRFGGPRRYRFQRRSLTLLKLVELIDRLRQYATSQRAPVRRTTNDEDWVGGLNVASGAEDETGISRLAAELSRGPVVSLEGRRSRVSVEQFAR